MHVNPAISRLLTGLNHPSLPGIDLSLTRMRELMAALGNPERTLAPVVHIAGTNGKGSTLAFLRAMLEAAGYRVHAYTSPHLVRFNERIVIGGSEISDAYLEQTLTRVADAARSIPVTFFEATTAAAFLAFAENAADIVLLETGLGGRLDATNLVAKPLATVLTPIDYDHMEFLGDTLASIAREKAGILKDGCLCVVGQQQAEAQEVVKRAARARHAPLLLHGRDWRFDAHENGIAVSAGNAQWTLPLPALAGAHQHHNAALASVVAKNLTPLAVSHEAMAKGAMLARWPARLQRLADGPLVAAWGARGPVMLDGGHNPSAARSLCGWLASQNEPVTLVCAMMARKDAASFIAALAPRVGRFIAVPITGEAAYTPEALAQIARAQGIADCFATSSLTDAARYFSPAAGCLVLAGSLYLAGEVLKNHS